MIWYAGRKLLEMAVSLVVVAVVVYLFVALAPSSGAPQISLGDWLVGILRGDLGRSADGLPVGGLVASRLAVSVPLILLALALALGSGGGLGLLASHRPGGTADRIVLGVAGVFSALPALWVGMVLAIIFAGALHWLPPGGFVPWLDNPLSALASLILPAIALAAAPAAGIARRVRRALVTSQQASYVAAAQMRGLTHNAAIAAHARRNALVMTLSTLAPMALAVVTGAVVVETVFYLPGLGRLIIDAIGTHDLVIVRSGVFTLAVVLLIAKFLVGLALGWADPRLVARAAI